MNGKKARLIRKTLKDTKIPNVNKEVKHQKIKYVSKIGSTEDKKEAVTVTRITIVNPFKSAYRKLKKAILLGERSE